MPDLIVVGAGVLGTWTALRAAERGRSTVLVDAFGPGDVRATSGDESRIIRAAHGADDVLPRWYRESREAWIALGEEAGSPIFERCGVAWFAHRPNGYEAESEATLRSLGIPVDHLTPSAAAQHWPIRADDLAFVLHEPGAGALRARDGVRAVAEAFRRHRGELRLGRVRPGRSRAGRLLEVVTEDGGRLEGESFVFAAGPWLASLFPRIVGPVLSVTRQDVVYVGPPPGDGRWTADAHPAWIDFDASFYGIPSIGGRGFKVAPDVYGPPTDPDTADRVIDAATIGRVRAYLARRFPDLAAAPVVETRVCQYETTPDTHWLIDRHPAWENAWLVGGGSGHAFKHGPRIGSYVVDRLDGLTDPTVDDRFSLARPRTLRRGDPRGAPPARRVPRR
jgi:glycine/D-amino acid oxidase-like deaminating enzyme